MTDTRRRNPFIRSEELEAVALKNIGDEAPDIARNEAASTHRRLGEPILPDKPKLPSGGRMLWRRNKKDTQLSPTAYALTSGAKDFAKGFVEGMNHIDIDQYERSAPPPHEITRVLITSTVGALAKKPLASIQNSYRYRQMHQLRQEREADARDLSLRAATSQTRAQARADLKAAVKESTERASMASDTLVTRAASIKKEGPSR